MLLNAELRAGVIFLMPDHEMASLSIANFCNSLVFGLAELIQASSNFFKLIHNLSIIPSSNCKHL